MFVSGVESPNLSGIVIVTLLLCNHDNSNDNSNNDNSIDDSHDNINDNDNSHIDNDDNNNSNSLELNPHLPYMMPHFGPPPDK